ncbi:Cl- channel voltage-gated family protein [Ammonifex degensii KC4]|uniref:Cl-channel voltage-gated family protein n=1 Tax=Ammonifex degensii (strain DSM 10501 / KC4) TaxID=429009 RepID=C9R8B5_AMMDK|nr:chloride channel protein [Ammonifex degensii]ACX52544.1 Cl- channel voltage-gated family protein [Ammonifex degensii KC4]
MSSKGKVNNGLHQRYLAKWLLIAGSIGAVAGVGAIVFYEAIHLFTYLFLNLGAGFHPPEALGEGQPVVTEISRRWMIPVVTTLGGLLSGLIVFKFAPEAEGHGTDAAIDAFHHKEGIIRARVPLVKIIASAITIGSGGSAGREGPTAQIAAGFGSIMGQLLKLNTRDRCIALATGIGAGIGAIFKAPLGGALLSTEILYLEGFEVQALVPSFIASLIGYTIFASYAGYMPVFGWMSQNIAFDPVTLLYYALLGVLCGLIGILYTKTFYATRNFFKKINLPKWLKPAAGGLLVGIMGLFLPQVLGMGYGWLQLGMLNKPLPLDIVVLLIFAKILATSLTIGSGGSGGVFAPGLFIGGMVGTALWQLLHGMVGHLPASPQPFIVVGMMALFGAVAHAPLAVMFMVGEMTGSYTMLVPAMIAVGIAYVLVGNNTIYESQVPTPADSPAHRLDYYLPLLENIKVKEVMTANIPLVTIHTSVAEAEELVKKQKIKGLPIVAGESNYQLLGVITREDIIRVPPLQRAETNVGQVMSAPPIVIGPNETLDVALTIMSDNDIAFLPVVEENKVVGLITRRDIIRTYILAAQKAGATSTRTQQQMTA